MATKAATKNASDKPLKSYRGIRPGMLIFINTTLHRGKPTALETEFWNGSLDQEFHRVRRVHRDGVDLVRRSKWTPPMRIPWRNVFIPASYVTEGRHPLI